MVTGSVASLIYGEPRVTHDLDLVVEMNVDDIDGFCRMFPIDDFYCPPAEIIETELKRSQRGHFNLIHHETGFKADIYLSGRDELHRWALERCTKIDVAGNTLWLAPVEYVILRKLEYYREGQSQKHLRDIHSILAVSGNKIDFEKLEDFIYRRGLKIEWQAARSYQ